MGGGTGPFWFPALCIQLSHPKAQGRASWCIVWGVPMCIQPCKNAEASTTLVGDVQEGMASLAWEDGRTSWGTGTLPWAMAHSSPAPSLQHCALLQLQRDRDTHPRGEHGQQHRQPAPQSQRVQSPSEPGADCELSRAKPTPWPHPGSSVGLVCQSRTNPPPAQPMCHSSSVSAPLLSSSLLKVESVPGRSGT